MNRALYIIGDYIHQLQKERGMACLYASQEGDACEDELVAQFKNTDVVVAEFMKAIKLWSAEQSLSDVILNKMASQVKKVDEWSVSRKAIIARDLRVADIVNSYTDMLISPLINIMVEISFFDKHNSPVHVTVFSNFLHWKEIAGRERALGILGFSTGNFSNNEYIDWLKSQIADQQSNKDLIINLADDRQKQCLSILLSSPAEEQTARINSALTGNADTAFLNQFNVSDWFRLMTQKMDLMREVEVQLVDTLAAHSQQDDEVPTNTQRIELESEDAHVNTKVSYQDQQFLNKLPLFNDLPTPTYEELLNHVQIDTYAKGKLLFLEGEQATRLYVILHGWVKLSKGNPAGEEAILQMFSSGDTLAESAVFLNVPFPESAQVVEPARIMTLPAPILREMVRKSNELAVNMLASMSRISRNFMRQIETTRLKSANERVGWFLLKLMLEQNRSKQNYVDLPFDKAIVASYLDMKPETLSRTLKRFRDLGFDVDRDRIRLPRVGALCNYCDVHLAASCENRNADHCLHSKH